MFLYQIVAYTVYSKILKIHTKTVNLKYQLGNVGMENWN